MSISLYSIERYSVPGALLDPEASLVNSTKSHRLASANSASFPLALKNLISLLLAFSISKLEISDKNLRDSLVRG